MTESDQTIPINDLRHNWLASDPEALDAVARVLASGWYVKGREHDVFEAELAAYLGVVQAVGLASGTDALVLSLLAVGCGSGRRSSRSPTQAATRASPPPSSALASSTPMSTRRRY